MNIPDRSKLEKLNQKLIRIKKRVLVASTTKERGKWLLLQAGIEGMMNYAQKSGLEITEESHHKRVDEPARKEKGQ